MDLQKTIDAYMAKSRADRLQDSPTLLLGELKLKLESVKGKSKPIVFDFGQTPAGADSWRGSYCELALEYSETGGGVVCFHHPDGTVDKRGWPLTVSIPLKRNPSTEEFLVMISTVLDKTMEGYKGGNYKMHKGVAVYVGNYGESFIGGYKGKADYCTVSVTDIVEEKDAVIIVTAETEY